VVLTMGSTLAYDLLINRKEYRMAAGFAKKYEL
jgi:hypothetical protein